jgi:hypothetical protein
VEVVSSGRSQDESNRRGKREKFTKGEEVRSRERVRARESFRSRSRGDGLLRSGSERFSDWWVVVVGRWRPPGLDDAARTLVTLPLPSHTIGTFDGWME